MEGLAASVGSGLPEHLRLQWVRFPSALGRCVVTKVGLSDEPDNEDELNSGSPAHMLDSPPSALY